MDPIVKRVEAGEGSWRFIDGSRRRAASLRSAYVGIGHYHVGWRWSVHVGAADGAGSAAHIGYVLSGRLCVRSAQGREAIVGPGEAFEVHAGHDAWVVGEEPCVALDFGVLVS